MSSGVDWHVVKHSVLVILKGVVGAPRSSAHRSEDRRIHSKRKGEGHSDRRSRGLSYHSNGTDAGGLDFRVRDGTG